MSDIEEKEHAKLSPSSAKRWMTCPGSIRMIEASLVKDKTSKYAAEGTVAHEVCELALKDGKDAFYYVGRKFTVGEFKFTVTEEMAEACNVYVDHILDRVAEFKEAGDKFQLRLEVRCSLKPLGVPGMDGGTTDSLMINHTRRQIFIDDYKHGQGVAVEVEGNPQTRKYALGALFDLGIDPEDDWEVFQGIIQPRASHPDGPIRNAEPVSSRDLFEWGYNTLVPAGLATMEPDAPLVPSEDGCRFCNAAGNCPALYQHTQSTALVDFADVAEAEEWGEPGFPSVEQLTAEQKVLIMDHIESFRGFLVAVENQVRIEIDHGSTEYQGKYKLVKSITRRKFNEDAADEDFSPLLDHLEEDDIYVKKMKGIGDIERLLKKKYGKDFAKELLSEITDRPEGSVVVARQSDKREEVQPSLTSDFTDLDE